MLSSIAGCFCAGTSGSRVDQSSSAVRQRVSSSILASPLLKSCGITVADVEANLDEYMDV